MAKPRGEPSTQLDVAGVTVDYARPPEELPTTKTRELTWLARSSMENTSGWRSGFVEGAAGVLEAVRRGEPLERIEADLRRRFGDPDIDRRLLELADQRGA